MTRRLRSHRAFRAEVDSAAAYFEEKAGLGNEFVAAIAAVVQSTLRNPRIGTPVHVEGATAEVRRRKIRRFRSYIADVVTDDAVHLLAVAHEGRKPFYWADRLPE